MLPPPPACLQNSSIVNDFVTADISCVVQAWEFQETPDDSDVETDETGESLASEFSAVRGLMGLPPSPSDDDPTRRQTRSGGDDEADDGLRGDPRYDEREGIAYGMYSAMDGRAAPWEEDDYEDEEGEGGDEDEEEGYALGFRSRFAQRPPKTNQDAADAAGAGVVAALMEVLSCVSLFLVCCSFELDRGTSFVK